MRFSYHLAANALCKVKVKPLVCLNLLLFTQELSSIISLGLVVSLVSEKASGLNGDSPLALGCVNFLLSLMTNSDGRVVFFRMVVSAHDLTVFATPVSTHIGNQKGSGLWREVIEVFS